MPMEGGGELWHLPKWLGKGRNGAGKDSNVITAGDSDGGNKIKGLMTESKGEKGGASGETQGFWKNHF